jgi:hypothetical protein
VVLPSKKEEEAAVTVVAVAAAGVVVVLFLGDPQLRVAMEAAAALKLDRIV